ncbi:hypothetical protein [Caballeronia sp. SL2Y3]|uniref:hypothetical protein n=1 Tax=Caballeronia sp. SL2Y3 TaxID=2878151 RepID=UPI001FD349B3|nr:hypothetical protein [Caballeronia sp. SL2Y3]
MTRPPVAGLAAENAGDNSACGDDENRETTMFDAQFVATFLNRCANHSSDEDFDSYLGVLREGNLQFTHELGYVGTSRIPDINACRTESLIFGDGSRALRVAKPDSDTGWSAWTALQPLP